MYTFQRSAERSKGVSNTPNREPEMIESHEDEQLNCSVLGRGVELWGKVGRFLKKNWNSIPNQVRSNKIAAKYDGYNFLLMVSNIRQRNGSYIAKTLPNQGRVKEVVENNGNLKRNTMHSDWQFQGVTIDKHQIPRMDVVGGVSNKRWFKAGKTTAKQLFIYRNSKLDEFVVSNSGFKIEYSHTVYDNGAVVKDGIVDAREGVYSVLEIRKSPSSITANGLVAKAGVAEVPHSGIWKIEPPKEGTLIWQVKSLN